MIYPRFGRVRSGCEIFLQSPGTFSRSASHTSTEELSCSPPWAGSSTRSTTGQGNLKPRQNPPSRRGFFMRVVHNPRAAGNARRWTHPGTFGGSASHTSTEELSCSPPWAGSSTRSTTGQGNLKPRQNPPSRRGFFMPVVHNPCAAGIVRGGISRSPRQNPSSGRAGHAVPRGLRGCARRTAGYRPRDAGWRVPCAPCAGWCGPDRA